VLKAIARKTRDGSIVLLHDIRRSPREMRQLLKETLAVLQRRGLGVVPLEALVSTAPYQETGLPEAPRFSAGFKQPLWDRLAGRHG